jgi:capsular polysaccharide biosynthesis protein
MAGPSAPLAIPQPDLMRSVANATVTRCAIVREARYHLGAVYDADGALVEDSLRFPDKHRARDPEALTMVQGLKVEQHLARGLYLGHAFTHFGHFLIETLPALWWARHVHDDVALIFHPFDKDSRNVFTDFPHGRDCLALLGLPADRIVMATHDLTVEDLLLPPRHYDMRTGPRYDFREIYRILVAAVRQSPPATAATRVFLSRRRLKRRLRRLSNDAAVERRIARRGFAVMHPQHMSLVDQIRAAAGVDLIAGVDGSALHLSVFMRPGARMLVLETKRRRTVHFINALMEVETISVPATTAAAMKRIDLGELDRALDDLGCPKPGPVGRILNMLDR